MSIAFLPITIDVRLPNEELLLEFCKQYKIRTTAKDGHSSWWDFTPVLMRATEEEVYDANKLKDILANRYNAGLGTPRYLNNIDKLFPEIPYMLEQLPYKELTLVTIMKQMKPVDYHTDTNDFDIHLDPTEVAYELEPKRYNILLNKHEYQDCLFVADQIGGTKIYPRIPKERPCHVIPDRVHAHGADYCGPDKLMLCVIGGILDRELHQTMIQDSLTKYSSEAIIFS